MDTRKIQHEATPDPLKPTIYDLVMHETCSSQAETIDSPGSPSISGHSDEFKYACTTTSSPISQKGRLSAFPAHEALHAMVTQPHPFAASAPPNTQKENMGSPSSKRNFVSHDAASCMVRKVLFGEHSHHLTAKPYAESNYQEHLDPPCSEITPVDEVIVQETQELKIEDMQLPLSKIDDTSKANPSDDTIVINNKDAATSPLNEPKPHLKTSSLRFHALDESISEQINANNNLINCNEQNQLFSDIYIKSTLDGSSLAPQRLVSQAGSHLLQKENMLQNPNLNFNNANYSQFSTQNVPNTSGFNAQLMMQPYAAEKASLGNNLPHSLFLDQDKPGNPNCLLLPASCDFFLGNSETSRPLGLAMNGSDHEKNTDASAFSVNPMPSLGMSHESSQQSSSNGINRHLTDPFSFLNQKCTSDSSIGQNCLSLDTHNHKSATEKTRLQTGIDPLLTHFLSSNETNNFYPAHCASNAKPLHPLNISDLSAASSQNSAFFNGKGSAQPQGDAYFASYNNKIFRNNISRNSSIDTIMTHPHQQLNHLQQQHQHLQQVYDAQQNSNAMNSSKVVGFSAAKHPSRSESMATNNDSAAQHISFLNSNNSSTSSFYLLSADAMKENIPQDRNSTWTNNAQRVNSLGYTAIGPASFNSAFSNYDNMGMHGSLSDLQLSLPAQMSGLLLKASDSQHSDRFNLYSNSQRSDLLPPSSFSLRNTQNFTGDSIYNHLYQLNQQHHYEASENQLGMSNSNIGAPWTNATSTANLIGNYPNMFQNKANADNSFQQNRFLSVVQQPSLLEHDLQSHSRMVSMHQNIAPTSASTTTTSTTTTAVNSEAMGASGMVGSSSGSISYSALPANQLSIGALKGQILKHGKDQNGCRFMQKQIEDFGEAAVGLIFPEILEHVTELMMDGFGNYLCQKLIEHCSARQRLDIAIKIKDSLINISLNTHGTRATQKLIEHLENHDEIMIIIRALEESNNTIKLIKDLNGNHVIQRCLQKFGAVFAVDQAQLSKHLYGIKNSKGTYFGLQTWFPTAHHMNVNSGATQYATQGPETKRGTINQAKASSCTANGVSANQGNNRNVNGTGSSSASAINSNAIKTLETMRVETMHLFLSNKYNAFVIDVICKNCIEVACHRHGCCVLQRCFDYSTNGQKKQLLDVLQQHAKILIQDPFGNYVIQYALEKLSAMSNPELDVDLLGRKFLRSIGTFAVQKFSSNVIEKCFVFCNEALVTEIADEIMQQENLTTLIQDPFGNYVIQTALVRVSDKVYLRFKEKLTPHLGMLSKVTYGKKIPAIITREDSVRRLAESA